MLGIPCLGSVYPICMMTMRLSTPWSSVYAPHEMVSYENKSNEAQVVIDPADDTVLKGGASQY